MTAIYELLVEQKNYYKMKRVKYIQLWNETKLYILSLN